MLRKQRPNGGDENHSEGIFIKCYKRTGIETCVHITDKSREFTAEELCLKAAEECKIFMLTFHLFRLATPDLAVWLPPNKVLKCSEGQAEEYVFRIRFRMPNDSISKLIRFDGEAFEYLYQQCHQDFLQDRVTSVARFFRPNEVKQKDFQEKILGLAVIDMILYTKMNGFSKDHLKKLRTEDYIPESSHSRYSVFWEKIRLSTNVKRELEVQYADCERDDVASIQHRYIMGVYQLVPEYGSECFSLNEEIICVDPYHTQHPGICSRAKHGNYDSGEVCHFCKIEDLQDASSYEYEVKMEDGTANNIEWKVKINKMPRQHQPNIPKYCTFKSQDLAESFLSLLDGYYRLTVDYNFHLSGNIYSPMIKQLRQLKCHGPVGRDWADLKLEAKTRSKVGSYILKQNMQQLSGYVLVVCTANKPTPTAAYRISKDTTDGRYFLAVNTPEPRFDSMQELLRHYHGDNSVLTLTERIPTSEKEISKLLLCREGNEPYVAAIKFNKDKQQEMVQYVSSVNTRDEINSGRFTRIYRGHVNKEKEVIQVAIKQIKKSDGSLLKELLQGVGSCLLWHHSSIVRVHALCLAPVSVLMDLSQFGSLNRYLQQPHVPFRVYSLVEVAEQIAQALVYIQHMDGVHGNICCKNILVFNTTPLEVKVADPGLVYHYNTLQPNHVLNADRLAWLAPELHDSMDNMTSQTDMFAYGTALWEVFSLGDSPLHELNSQEKMDFMSHGHCMECPQHCPADIYSIMCDCWSLDPDQRPQPKAVVRDIRQLVVEFSPSSYNAPRFGEHCETLQSCEEEGAEVTDSNSAAAPDPQVHEREAKHKERQQRADLQRLLDKQIGSYNYGNSGHSHQHRMPSHVEMTNHYGSRTPLLPPAGGHENFGGHHNMAVDLRSASSSVNSSEMSGTSHQTQETTLSGVPHRGHLRIDVQSRPLPEPPTSSTDVQYILKRERITLVTGASLGEGHYGFVEKAYLEPQQSDHSGKRKMVAVKSLHQHHYEKYIKEFEEEMKIMTSLSHENIVRVEGMCPMKNDVNPMYLVMEYVEKGSLRDFLTQCGAQVTARIQINIAHDMARGMHYLTQKKIIHRDLAARNVLITKDYRGKISDFGLARALNPERDYYKCSKGDAKIPALWSAPEALLSRKFTMKSDVWSYGVTLWELYSPGRDPKTILAGKHISHLSDILKENKRLERPTSCPVPLYDMMKKCWHYEAQERPTFETLIEEVARISNEIHKTKKDNRRQTVS